MKLFEGGIVDKITNDEYEKMFQQMNGMQVSDVDEVREGNEKDRDENREIDENRKELQQQEIISDGNANARKEVNEKELTALSLQMLQGAFYLLIFGNLLAFVIFFLEIGCHRFSESLAQILRKRIFTLNRRCRQLRTRINRFRFSM